VTSARGPGAEPERFFFVHVQKTAGTSLSIRLGHQFAPHEIYPDDTDGDQLTVMPQLDMGVLQARWAARRDQIRLVAGHFPLATTDLLGGGFATFTVVREPVERTLSYLRHFRKMTRQARDLSLEELYEDPLRYEGLIHDHMTKVFGLGVDQLADGIMARVDHTPELLERAKAGLASVDVIGLQEEFDLFCARLESRFGWQLGEALVANHTPHVDVDPAFRRRIAADNALDVELYRYARQLVAERAAPTGR
jgi:hypothetical protein